MCIRDRRARGETKKVANAPYVYASGLSCMECYAETLSKTRQRLLTSYLERPFFGNIFALRVHLIRQLKGLVQIHDNSVIVETEKNAVEVVFVFICDNFVR